MVAYKLAIGACGNFGCIRCRYLAGWSGTVLTLAGRAGEAPCTAVGVRRQARGTNYVSAAACCRLNERVSGARAQLTARPAKVIAAATYRMASIP